MTKKVKKDERMKKENEKEKERKKKVLHVK